MWPSQDCGPKRHRTLGQFIGLTHVKAMEMALAIRYALCFPGLYPIKDHMCLKGMVFEVCGELMKHLVLTVLMLV